MTIPILRTTKSEIDHGVTEHSTVHVACCVDDEYVKGAAVTLVSAARNLGERRTLHVELVDGGISEVGFENLQRTCEVAGVRLRRHRLDLKRLSQLPVSHHISHAAYIRLLLAEVLPKDLDRVLYLDGDLLVLDDIGRLYDESLEDHWAAAVPDIACPYIDATRVVPNLRQCGPYMATYRPVPNYRELRLRPDQPYFNSGVMLIDLDQWRRQDLASQFLGCLDEHSESVWCWDQYALNVVLAERWKVLPLRWNCGGHLYEYHSSNATPFPEDESRAAFAQPAIVHFTTKDKPWHRGYEHPHRATFYEYLDQTAWEGWRPTADRNRLASWWSSQCEGVQKQAIIAFRKWQLRLGWESPS
jgi:lipopolysaccharide biosynthesis glycosyltransferase